MQTTDPRIKFIDAGEYFGMAGPWLSDCLYNDRKLKKKYLDQNLIASSDKQYLGLSQYTAPGKINVLGLFSWTPSIREFRIVIINTKTAEIFISKNKYDALYLENVTENKIVFYPTFHDQSTRDLLLFDDQHFNRHRLEELYE